MPDKRIALVTGANQGVGLQVAKELVANGVTVLVGSRNFERGEAAAREIGAGAIALQLDVTDRLSIAAAAERIREEFGRLDLLVQNAAISNTRKGNLSLQEYAKITRPSNVSLDELRTVWETNVFGVLAVYQAMLPLLRESSDARIVNVSSIMGSLTLHSDPSSPIYHSRVFAYNTSKAALNSFTIHLAYELRDTSIKVNSADPGWVKTEMGGENADLEVSEGGKTSAWLARLPEDGPTGGYFHAGQPLPW